MNNKPVIGLSLLIIIALGWLSNDYLQYTQWVEKSEAAALKQASNEVKKTIPIIESTLNMVERSALALAEELNTGKANVQNLDERQRAISKDNPDIFGLGVAFKPEWIKKNPVATNGKGRPNPRKNRKGIMQQANLCLDQGMADYLFAPYLKREDQGSQARKRVMVNESYDYTCKPKYWYTCPLGLVPDTCPKPSGAMWLEPYFGEASQRMVAEFAVPFYTAGGKERGEEPIGVVWANMTLDDFTELLASLKLGGAGYSFILSPKGVYIAHPLSSKTEGAVTIKQESSYLTGTNLSYLFDAAKKNGTQVGEQIDPLSQKEAWWVFEPTAKADWVLGAVFIKDELLGNPLDRRRQLIEMSFSGMLVLMASLLLIVGVKPGKEDITYWRGVGVVSISLILMISVIWSLAIKYPDYDDANVSRFKHESIISSIGAWLKEDTKENVFNIKGTGEAYERYWPNKILSQGQLKSFEKSYQHEISKIGNSKDWDVVYLPTGVFIQSAKFIGSSDIQVTGYLWQKLPPSDPICTSVSKEEQNILKFEVLGKSGTCVEVKGGVIFPEAENSSLSETYRRKRVDGGITIGWYFDVTLREPFSYEQYPFDVENVWIRIWHSEIGSTVVLTPDLAAYPVLTPMTKPGLEEDFVLPGWNIVGSYFGYRNHSYTTNFGLPSYSGQENFPELHFNILLKREFIGPFINTMMPVIVVGVILFALLLTITNKEEKSVLGFDTSGILGSNAGLFFGVLIGHSQLRSQLESSGMVYIENFFLIMYCALLLVSINAYLFSVKINNNFILWRDNLAPKLMYWPIILLLVLIVTMRSFY
ncbi:MAG: hypothetical protein HQL71_14740 [Magnetococcales bacterium]|nr:hypothetical protein [Magnetococcales bacterium]